MKFVLILFIVGLASADPPVLSTTLKLKTVNNGAAYYTEMSIGTPPQTFKVGLDMSSPVTFVPSADCDKSQKGCGSHARYASFKSSSYIGVGSGWSLASDKTNINGYYSIDNATIGNISLPYQTFGEAVQATFEPFNVSQVDGMLGLGLQTPNLPNSLLGNVRQFLGGSTAFGLQLKRDSSDDGGVLELGDQRSGTFHTVDIVDSDTGAIQLYFDKIQYGDPYRGPTYPVNCNAQLSTNTQMISIKNVAAMNLHRAMGATQISQGKFVFDCAKLDKLQNITISLGNKNSRFRITPKDYVTVTDTPIGKFCLSNIDGLGDASSDSGCKLGSTFLSKFYIAVSGNEVNFASNDFVIGIN